MLSLYRRKNRFCSADAVGWDHLLFTDCDLKKLLWPVIAEQLLNSLMGMMDTMMVSRTGSAAFSAVSLVDSINILFIQIFAAMATGGTILCSQYLGAEDRKPSNRAAQQIALSSLVISVPVQLSVSHSVSRFSGLPSDPPNPLSYGIHSITSRLSGFRTSFRATACARPAMCAIP